MFATTPHSSLLATVRTYEKVSIKIYNVNVTLPHRSPKCLFLAATKFILLHPPFFNGFDHSLNLEKTRPLTPRPDPGDKLFLNQIMSDLHQTYRISSYSSTNLVKDDLILWASGQEPSTSSKPLNLCFISQIMSDRDQTFRTGPIASTNIIFDV